MILGKFTTPIASIGILHNSTISIVEPSELPPPMARSPEGVWKFVSSEGVHMLIQPKRGVKHARNSTMIDNSLEKSRARAS